MRIHLTNKEIVKLWEEKAQFRHYCKCGHSVYIVNSQNKAICSHCKNLVFKDKETEFKYRMREKLIKERKNERGKD